MDQMNIDVASAEFDSKGCLEAWRTGKDLEVPLDEDERKARASWLLKLLKRPECCLTFNDLVFDGEERQRIVMDAEAYEA